MLEDKIINNRFDNVEYGTEALSQAPISINPAVYDRYEESLSDDVSEIYVKRKMYEDLEEIYQASPYYKKYGKDVKKLEKRDISDIYYSFKDELNKRDSYTLVQIFCGIAEFFDLNYKILYNDIISLEDKAEILELLQEAYGLESDLGKSKKLF